MQFEMLIYQGAMRRRAVARAPGVEAGEQTAGARRTEDKGLTPVADVPADGGGHAAPPPVLPDDGERAAAASDWSERWAALDLVFTTTAGTPIDASNLRRYFRWACRRAGIGRWMPYEMRHLAASLLSADWVRLVADMLGHDGTRMVAQVYRHAVAPTIDVGTVRMRRLLAGIEGANGASPGVADPSPTPLGASGYVLALHRGSLPSAS